MFPKYFPVLTKDHIIPPPPKYYEDKHGRKSTIGWLKELFLYHICSDNKECIQINSSDREDYKNVLDKFRKINKIKASISLHEWEESASAQKQATALNKLRRSLGYTQIIN